MLNLHLESLDQLPAKILIIDDDPVSVVELETILSPIASIITLPSGNKALDTAKAEQPDLIILDINMPGMSGFEVCKQIQQDPATAHIAIIFVTSFDANQNEVTSLKLGAIDFISKPIIHDICLHRVKNLLLMSKQAKSLSAAKDELVDIVRQVPNFISFWDAEWNNLFSNDFEGKWFGFDNRELLYQPLSLILPLDVMRQMGSTLADHEGLYRIDTSFDVTLGERRYFSLTWSESTCPDGKHGFILTIADVTQQKQNEFALIDQKEQLSVLLSSIAEGVIATDSNGLVTFINPKAELITGWYLEDALNKSIESIMQLRDPDTKINAENPIRIALRQHRVTTMPLNTQLLAKNGRISDIEETAAPVRNFNGEVIGAVAVIHDISHSVSLSLLRNQITTFDAVTEIPNRLFIQEKLKLACESVTLHGANMAVAVIDIDHFKFFNDNHGNLKGDKALRIIARRLFENFEPIHSVGRLAADEFIVIFRDVSDDETLYKLVSELLDLARCPLKIDDEEFTLSLSIGVANITRQSNDPDMLLQQADAALYRAKFEGGNRYLIFSDELQNTLLQKRSTEELLRKAIATPSMIQVFYQSKVDLKSGSILGCEALVRLCETNGNIVSPVEFIPIAEESGLILPLGRQVLYKACEEWRKWYSSGFDINLSVNVSVVQCLNDNFVNDIVDAIHATGMDPTRLELEVTETAFIRNFEQTLDKFATLKQMGIQISIDDFGKGYSNLTYLRRLDVDKLKLDMSYVQGMLDNERDYELVKTIILLGQSMNLKLVAEGIETIEHRDALLKLGCLYGQGYLYSKPLPAETFFNYLSKNQQVTDE